MFKNIFHPTIQITSTIKYNCRYCLGFNSKQMLYLNKETLKNSLMQVYISKNMNFYVTYGMSLRLSSSSSPRCRDANTPWRRQRQCYSHTPQDLQVVTQIK